MNDISYVKSIKLRYIIGLSAIALLATASFITMNRVVSEQRNFSTLINLAGHQSGLASRLAYFSSIMATTDDEAEFNIARAQVGRSINKMESSHKILHSGDSDMGIPVVSNEHLRTIYKDPMMGLDLALERFLEQARVVYNTDFNSFNKGLMSYVYLTTYGPHALEPLLDAAVDEYDRIARTAISKIERLEMVIWLATILALLLEMLFIFNPVENRIKKTISSLNEAIEKLTRTQTRLLEAQKLASLGDWQLTADKSHMNWSDQVYEICGVSKKIFRVSLETSMQLIHPDDRGTVKASLLNVVRHDIPLDIEYRIIRPDGLERQIHQRTLAIRDRYGNVEALSGTVQDITERKISEDKIRKLALFDPLTGLANRRLLRDRLKQEMAAACRNHEYGAVLLLDMDNFKTLNDTKGHIIGDALLVEVGERIRSSVRDTDTIARLGGDEFVVILETIGRNEKDAKKTALYLAGEIKDALSKVYVFGNDNYHTHYTSASIGIVIFDGTEGSEDELIKRADVAMFEAKENGRNQIRVYSRERQTFIDSRTSMAHNLQNALDNNEFSLYYQPQVTSAGKICGAEALLRWFPPGEKPVSPGLFVPVAEDTGLILPIGEWVLETACRDIRKLCRYDLPARFAVAVNISARQFSDRRFLKKIKTIIDRNGVDYHRLKFELTESYLLQDIERVQVILRALQKMGLNIELDDFGTGYSSLTSLKNLPLNTLKLDGTLVRGIGGDSRDDAIVRAAIKVGKALSLDIIAEGVETKQQSDFLIGQGCDMLQGYLFARPMPFEKFETVLCRSLEAQGKADDISDMPAHVSNSEFTLVETAYSSVAVRLN